MYNFTMFDDMVNGFANIDYLIDVIGEVVEIGHWNLHGKPKKVVFTMINECESIISCTLWEALAMELKECLDRHVVGPVVLLLSMTKIKEARDHFLHNARVKCFDEVSQVKKKCMCVIGATITKLLVDNGWIYDVCPRCNKKVDGEALSFICVSYGNESASTIPRSPFIKLYHRFCVDVRVAQPHESAIFTL
ncbi:hypothetical protein JHK82_040351 [Glycine max]|nr:hypothetical protein JHK85_041132 [Glycine max]KAG5111128.1 hypothetical protein JHK82_040351 [Glycine max]KAG5122413.1 hypothetical protein JHK84_040753 [Glycine max]